MKKEITVGQLLSVGATILIAMATGWITLNNKVSSHEIQIKNLEQKLNKMEVIEQKIDKINEGQTQILIRLENKKDRE